MEMERLVYALGSLAHAELHLIEQLTPDNAGSILPLMKAVREARIGLGSPFIDEKTWCIVKHLAIALIYIDELIERASEKEAQILSKSRAVLKDLISLFIKAQYETPVVCREAERCA
ncbi:MAG: hypothetical protein ACP5KA_06110 [Desulfurococcaceae archaeon]